MLLICVQHPYRTCIFDLYVSNILTGQVYFETFVRVVFGRSLSGVCLITLPDICSLYVFNILTEHVSSIFMCPISLPGMYYSKSLLESSSVGLFLVHVSYPYLTYAPYMCSISLPNMYIRSLCVHYRYRACISRNLC